MKFSMKIICSIVIIFFVFIMQIALLDVMADQIASRIMNYFQNGIVCNVNGIREDSTD